MADPDAAVIVGVAAHITAAAVGGPRYDAALTQSDRSSISNGIWLCQTCARLIDVDPEGFPVQLLQTWKRDHEASMARSLFGRFAELDRQHVEALAQQVPVSLDELLGLVPAPDAPSTEVVWRTSAVYRPQRNEIVVSAEVINAGLQDLGFDVALLRIPGAEAPFDFAGVADGPLVSVEDAGPWVAAEVVRAGTTRRYELTLHNAEEVLRLEEGFTAGAATIVLRSDGTSDVDVTIDSVRSLIDRAVGKKLRPLSQWLCDECGLPILRPRDGWLEYTDGRPDEIGQYTGFRIVHHFLASPRNARPGCYGTNDTYTMHLHHLLENGISWALALIGDGLEGHSAFRADTVRDMREWSLLVKRLWVPYYEQARHYFARALADDYIDVDSLSGYAPDTLERLIERYVSDELTPEMPP